MNPLKTKRNNMRSNNMIGYETYRQRYELSYMQIINFKKPIMGPD